VFQIPDYKNQITRDFKVGLACLLQAGFLRHACLTFFLNAFAGRHQQAGVFLIAKLYPTLSIINASPSQSHILGEWEIN